MHSCQKNPEKSYTEKKTKHTSHCLHIAHLIQQKTSLIVTEGKTVWKGFARIYKSMPKN